MLLGPLSDFRPSLKLRGFLRAGPRAWSPDVLGPESGPHWLLTPEDRLVAHGALGAEKALEDTSRSWGHFGWALLWAFAPTAQEVMASDSSPAL